jgi:hypothetical protein
MVYCGHLDEEAGYSDAWDCFTAYLYPSGHLTSELQVPDGPDHGVQLLLYYRTYTDVLKWVADPPYNLDYDYSWPADWYFVCATARIPYSSSDLYRLRVTFP